MKMPAPNQDVLDKRSYLVDTLRRIVSNPDAVIDDEADLRAFECDGLSAYRQLPMIAVLPESVAEIAEILKFCAYEGVNVVPRGAGTSLSGGLCRWPTACCSGLENSTRSWMLIMTIAALWFSPA